MGELKKFPENERCEFCKDGKTFLGAVLVLGNDGNWHSIRYCPNCGAKMQEANYVPEDPLKCFTCYWNDYDRADAVWCNCEGCPKNPKT